MNPHLQARTATQRGVILTRDAHAAGYDTRSIARELATGRWHRLRRGAYVPMELWQGVTAEGRHLLTARAVQLQSEATVALTHTTGALALGLGMWRPALEGVHVTHLGTQTGRVEYGVHHHQGLLDLAECVHRDGLLIGPPTSVVAGAMIQSDFDGAVVVGDAALGQGLTDVQRLEALGAAWLRMPDSRSLRWRIGHLDDGAANLAESLTRVRLRDWGIPRPQLQFQIRDGDFLAVTDFAWPERGVVGEFDGKRKYLRDLNPGEDPGEVVFREKVREDRLRALGWIVVRVTWADLFDFEAAAQRFHRALRTRRAA